ncbi:hypothetical protein [Cytobacillus massiliigabonensis]|uniref:hypothetical protein n=1 Tax=Cytobacillus massiliigabonensis TaxID=1871011 RepID=UPI000C8340F2|nr:hypothetical protein [Cytobacillus massiliigabonensis]
MINKIVLTALIAFLINTSHTPAKINRSIEIYDINQEMVIKTITNSPLIRKESELILQGINDIYKKFNPIPEQGLLVKVPLEPAIHVSNQWINTLVDELIIFYPEDEEPFILVYDDENNTYFFTISQKSAAETLIALLFSH